MSQSRYLYKMTLMIETDEMIRVGDSPETILAAVKVKSWGLNLEKEIRERRLRLLVTSSDQTNE